MNRIRKRFLEGVGLERFTIYNLVAIFGGGLIAALLMRPWLDAGPVRLTTYVVFFLSSMLLAQRYLAIIRESEDGLASVFLIAACLWWMSFAVTAIAIEYLIIARVYGFWPHLSQNMQERIAYFFISGAAVGVFFKAITFRFIPKQTLMGRRVQAWPLTIARRRRQEMLAIDELEHDERVAEQNEREAEQDARQQNLDEREQRLRESE